MCYNISLQPFVTRDNIDKNTSTRYARSMFLCDLSQHAFFNRKLNLAHLPKTKSGFAHLKAGVKRTRDALDDLRRKGGRSFEGGYTVNNTSGKLGEYFTNKKKNMIDIRTVIQVPPKNGVMSFLHNHPRNSSLSISDLLNTNPYAKDQIVNTTPGGSYFRGRLKKEPNPQEIIKTRQKIINKVDYEFRQLKPGKLSPKDLDRRSFIASHLVNRSLANQGVIHYRAKLTPKDRRTIDFWLQRSPKLKSLYDGKN